MSFPHPLQVTAMAAVWTMMSALSDESKLIAVSERLTVAIS